MRAGRQEHAAHKPLMSSVIVADVPLALYARQNRFTEFTKPALSVVQGSVEQAARQALAMLKAASFGDTPAGYPIQAPGVRRGIGRNQGQRLGLGTVSARLPPDRCRRHPGKRNSRGLGTVGIQEPRK